MFPILLSQSFIISSTCTFSIPFVVPKILIIVYNTSLDFITFSNLLNFFKSKTISSLLSANFKSSKFLSTCFSIYSSSSPTNSDSLFNVFIILGLNSFFIYGINIFLILFLVYSFSKFVLSILGSKFFSLQ